MPGYGVVQQARRPAYFAEPVGAFAMQQQPGYPATQQPPAMHDQIRASAPRRPAAAERRRDARRIALPAHRGRREHDAAPRGRLARVRRETRAGRRSERRCASGPRARAHPRAGTGGGVPASYVSAEAAHAAQYAPYATGSFYDGAPPVAGVIGAHAPGGMVRMERNSRSSAGAAGAAAAA